MKTAVAAADFEAHEELRLLLWALLEKRISRLQAENEVLRDFGVMNLKSIADRVWADIQAHMPEA